MWGDLKVVAEWNGMVLEAAPTLLLLFLFVGRLCIPVEEDLGSNEAIAEGRDHKDSSHEGVSSFLFRRDTDLERFQWEQLTTQLGI